MSVFRKSSKSERNNIFINMFSGDRSSLWIKEKYFIVILSDDSETERTVYTVQNRIKIKKLMKFISNKENITDGSKTERTAPMVQTKMNIFFKSWK